MKNFKFENKIFLEISPKDIEPDVLLCCSIYIFLQKNNRMIRVREKESQFEDISLLVYSEKVEHLYVLDPKEYPESFNFGLHPIDKINPKIPDSYLQGLAPAPTQLEAPAPASPVESAIAPIASADLSNSPGITSPNPESSLVQAPAEEIPGTKVALQLLEEEDSPTKSPPGAVEEIQEEIFSPNITGNTPAPTLKLVPNEPETDAAFKLKAEKDEAPVTQKISSSLTREGEAKFAAEISDSFTTKIKGQEEIPEEEQVFSSSKEKEAPQFTQKLSAVPEEIPIEQSASSWASSSDEESKRLTQNVEELEETFASFSAESKEFVEELHNIRNGEVKNNPSSPWRVKIPEDSPLLKGLGKEDAAAIRFSHSVGNHLSKLRAELHSASKIPPKDKKSAEEISERKKELKKAIEEKEVLLVLVETIDDEEMELRDLPESFQDKSKEDLLRYVEKSIQDLKGTAILSETDSTQIQKKVDHLKAKQFSIYGDTLGYLKERMAQEQEFSQESLKKIQGEIFSEVAKANLSIKITNEVIQKKGELATLLKEANSDSAQATKKEELAFRLQEEIQKLESLAFSVESGEPIEEFRIKPYKEKIPEEFVFSADKEPKVEIIRLSGSLEDLKQTVISKKIEAQQFDAKLEEALNGSQEIKISSSENKIEEEIRTLVSGSSAKNLQRGFFATTFFRFLGYRNPKLEKDLLLVSFLQDSAEIPENIRPLFEISQKPTMELAALDIYTALQCAKRYNETPGVITGKFTLDPKLVEDFYQNSKTSIDLDPLGLERIRQNAQIPIPTLEREALLHLARDVASQAAKLQRKNAESP